MARFIKKRKQEIGLSPDDLVFRGDRKSDEVVLRIIDFDANTLEEDAIKTVNEVLAYQEKNTVTWLNIDGLHNISVMEEIVRAFDLDHLVMAEVMNTQARSKVIDYDNCTLISIKMLQLNETTGSISVENLA